MIGSHSNGTGAGHSYTKVLKNEDWKDPFQIFSLSIPNMLFVSPVASTEAVSFEASDALMAMNSENRPVEADVQYSPDPHD